MSTRCVVSFIDEGESFHVYKHHDGYPIGVIEAIHNALPFAWQLPRFQASEFAAAFVAANKVRGGGIYLTTHWNKHGDLDYRYQVSRNNHGLTVEVFDVYHGGECIDSLTIEQEI